MIQEEHPMQYRFNKYVRYTNGRDEYLSNKLAYHGGYVLQKYGNVQLLIDPALLEQQLKLSQYNYKTIENKKYIVLDTRNKDDFHILLGCIVQVWDSRAKNMIYDKLCNTTNK